MSFNFPDEVRLLLGSRNVKTYTRKPFQEQIIDFFDQLSKELFKDKEAKNFDDLILYAFFIRSANIKKLINNQDNDLVGRGLAFHINTSNVPLNFAYSLFYGLIFGNTNILKVSRTTFDQSIFLIKKIKKILQKKKFNFLKNFLFIIQYDNQEFISNLISINSDIRIIWGSDQTITKFKNIESNPRVVDLYFPDRISLSLINSDEYLSLKNKNTLIDNFYKDSLYFDQLGCSSPHTVLWIGKQSKVAAIDFWSKFSKRLNKRYPFDLRKAYDKAYHLFKLTNNFKNKYKFNIYENRFMIFDIIENVEIIKELKGLNGIFFQSFIKDINLLNKFVSKKTQTLTIFGLDKKILINSLYDKSITGIDRIVNVGSALNMNINWDGYNLKYFLTRKIEQY